MAQMHVLRRNHPASYAQLRHLLLRKIASMAAHRIENLEEIAVIVIHAPYFDGRIR
jgi:hypothetical protein